MASEISYNAFFSVNSVDLSDQIRSVQFSQEFEEHDKTAFGDRSHSIKTGMNNWQFEVNFYQDFIDPASVHETLAPLRGSQGFPVVYRKEKGTAASPTNPQYSGSVVLSTLTPVAGTVAALLMQPVTFLSAGALTRAEA